MKGYKPMPIHNFCSWTKSDHVAQKDSLWKISDGSLDKPLYSLVHKFTTSMKFIAIRGLNKESYSESNIWIANFTAEGKEGNVTNSLYFKIAS